MALAALRLQRLIAPLPLGSRLLARLAAGRRFRGTRRCRGRAATGCPAVPPWPEGPNGGSEDGNCWLSPAPTAPWPRPLSCEGGRPVRQVAHDPAPPTRRDPSAKGRAAASMSCPGRKHIFRHHTTVD